MNVYKFRYSYTYRGRPNEGTYLVLAPGEDFAMLDFYEARRHLPGFHIEEISDLGRLDAEVRRRKGTGL